MSSVEVESAMRQWEAGYKRFQEETASRPRADRLHDHLELVTAELRRRVGETFTLAELAGAYAEAETWTRDAVGDADELPGWERTVAVVEDAAFHLYARGAVDYAP
jgi:hypothetical protein